MRAKRYGRRWRSVSTILILIFSSRILAKAIPTSMPSPALIETNMIRRADDPKGRDLETSTFDEDSHPNASVSPRSDNTLTALAQQGKLVLDYLQASDAQITADLIRKGLLQNGQRLASGFTDFSAFRRNGWDGVAKTALLAQSFSEFMPFLDMLRSLRISDQASPIGKNEYMEYEHTLPWQQGGHVMLPVGEGASFSLVTNPEDAFLAVLWAYSPRGEIERQRLDGIVAPPLSELSDMAFLDWKRACTRFNTSPKALKHLLLALVTSETTQHVVQSIFLNRGRSVPTWADLPSWVDRLTLQPDSFEGRALLATVQLKEVMWMLIRHREHLGKKTIRQISLFKDELTGEDDAHDVSVRGPSIYLELEDVR